MCTSIVERQWMMGELFVMVGREGDKGLTSDLCSQGCPPSQSGHNQCLSSWIKGRLTGVAGLGLCGKFLPNFLFCFRFCFLPDPGIVSQSPDDNWSEAIKME